MRRRTFLSALGASTAAAAAGPVAASDGRIEEGSTATTAAASDDDGQIKQMLFGSTSSLLAPDLTPLEDDSLVAVYAESTAEVRDRDGNGDAVSYPEGTDIPLVCVDGSASGSVVGIGAQLVNDGGLVPELAGEDPLVDLGNEEFLLNCYDEYVDGDRILWDESHGQFYDLDSFRNFEAYVENNGYELAASDDLPADLPDADGVVITSPSEGFSDDELTALSEFVDAGGAVFLHDQSDFSDFDATGNLNAVAEGIDLGFRFNDAEVGDPESNIGIAYLPLTANFNADQFDLFDDRPGITVDIRRGESYEVDVVGVADGDTFDVEFAPGDVGLETPYEAEVRVLGVDTPESAAVAAAAERPEEWEGLAYDIDASTLSQLKFDSTASQVAPDMTPLEDDSVVAVAAEDTATNEDADGNGDAVSYPDDAAIPLVCAEGSVMGLGAPFVNDGAYAAALDNEEFLLNAYDELIEGEGGTVLWDESHGQFYGLDRFGEFAGIAGENGYTLSATGDLVADLPDADAVVITSPSEGFSEEELTALTDFVDDGGAVFLHDQSDFRDFDATDTLNAVAEALELSFRFNDDQVLDEENNTGAPFVPTTTQFDTSFPFFDQRPGSDGSTGENTTPYLVEWANRASDFAFDALGRGEDGTPTTVRLSFDENEPLRDPTRLLAYAEYDSDGDGSYDTLYNRKLIEDGYARVYGSSLARHDEFWALEDAARREGRGVWAESDVSAASPYREGPVRELFVPDPTVVTSSEGSLSSERVPVFAESSATVAAGGDGRVPLAALDEGNRVALVGGPVIDEGYEAGEGFPVDTSGFDNFAFLTAVIEYLTDREGDVLIDGGHGQFGAGYALSSEDAAYYQRHLEGRGYSLEQVNEPTAEKLQRGRAYLVTSPAEAFTEAELDAVRSFQESGGAVVVLGSADAPPIPTANTASLVGALGTDLRFGRRVRDPESNLNGDPTVPVTANVNPASPVVDAPSGPVGRADDDGSGKIETDELRSAIADWSRGEYTTDELVEIVRNWAASG